MTSRANVLIAGAGPTGLTLAIELARRDIRCRVVDAASGPAKSSRGKGVQPRTLEVFEDLGVLDAVQAAGGLYPRFRVHAGPLSFAAGRLNKVAEPSPSVPFPNLWLLPQWRTEGILRARLERLGSHVEFGASLTSFDQERDSVTATISTVAGIERVRSDYLVGCDGGHSVVRKGLGVRFEGEELPARPVVLADVEIDGLDSKYWHVWREPGNFSSPRLCRSAGSHPSRPKTESVSSSRVESAKTAYGSAASHGRRSFDRTFAWSIAIVSVECCSPETPRTCIRRQEVRG
jgi:2-polyprenyl-6-methoxyphenol hydroxylase-like FAD-dependent oxidoreductase